MNDSITLKSILLVAANPKGTVSLRLQEEEREIRERLRLAGYGKVPISSTGATRPRDIQQAMVDFKPQVVHFSGHGAGQDGLAFEDVSGQLKLVDSEALANLFKLFSKRVECVVLNACYSKFQAEAISQHINYVVGMNQSIGDRAAIVFSVGFYTALGAGEPIEFAYELGCNAIQLEGIPEHLTPVLHRKNIPVNVIPRDLQTELPVHTTSTFEPSDPPHSSVAVPKSESLSIKRNFWFQWVLANCIGASIGWGVIGVVGWTGPFGVPGLGWSIVGSAVGILQWLVLRQQLQIPGWWVIATIIGWAVSWDVGWNLSHSVGNMGTVGVAAINGILTGSTVGVLQWLVLRQRVKAFEWWIVANIIAWFIAWIAGEIIGMVYRASLGNYWVGIFIGFIIGTLSGAITGSTLIWLSRYSQMRT